MRKKDQSSARARHITLRARVASREEARRLVSLPGDAVLIVRGRPISVLMVCPCGCGDQLTINLDRRCGPAWRCLERFGLITLYPSVWRESGCKSHFVIWQNEIYLFGQNDFDRKRHPNLERRVYEQLADGQARHFADIAESLSELPWSVLIACDNLASDGKISVLEGPNRGTFVRLRPAD